MAAEYILKEGNPRVILCERGIKTFEQTTRYTLDLGSVADHVVRAPIKARVVMPVQFIPTQIAAWVYCPPFSRTSRPKPAPPKVDSPFGRDLYSPRSACRHVPPTVQVSGVLGHPSRGSECPLPQN